MNCIRNFEYQSLYQTAEKFIEASYIQWFNINNTITGIFRSLSPAIAAIYAMISLELPAVLPSFYEIAYAKSGTPETYGFKQISKDSLACPISLLHGAAGSWNYLEPLASKLKEEGRSIFPLDLGFGGNTVEKRKLVLEEIQKIQKIFYEVHQKETKVDIVAHSMGGNIAFSALFEESCCLINSEGEPNFLTNAIENPNVQKVVTIAMPYEIAQVEKIQSIKKENKVFNILAQYDGIVGHKVSALEDSQKIIVPAGHIGIVFDENVPKIIENFLLQ